MMNELDAEGTRLAEALMAEFGIEHDVFCLTQEQCWQAERWETEDGERIGKERDGRKLKVIVAIFHGKNIAELGGTNGTTRRRGARDTLGTRKDTSAVQSGMGHQCRQSTDYRCRRCGSGRWMCGERQNG